jgi:Ricin-type beta-trefoil lectin domain-like
VSGDVYQVVAVNSGLCLALSGDSTAVGAALVQVSCTTATTRTWTIAG